MTPYDYLIKITIIVNVRRRKKKTRPNSYYFKIILNRFLRYSATNMDDFFFECCTLTSSV